MAFRYGALPGNFNNTNRVHYNNTYTNNAIISASNSALAINKKVEQLPLNFENGLSEAVKQFLEENPDLPIDLKLRISHCQTNEEIYEEYINYYYEQYNLMFGFTRDEVIAILTSDNPEEEFRKTFRNKRLTCIQTYIKYLESQGISLPPAIKVMLLQCKNLTELEKTLDYYQLLPTVDSVRIFAADPGEIELYEILIAEEPDNAYSHYLSIFNNANVNIHIQNYLTNGADYVNFIYEEDSKGVLHVKICLDAEGYFDKTEYRTRNTFDSKPINSMEFEVHNYEETQEVLDFAIAYTFRIIYGITEEEYNEFKRLVAENPDHENELFLQILDNNNYRKHIEAYCAPYHFSEERMNLLYAAKSFEKALQLINDFAAEDARAMGASDDAIERVRNGQSLSAIVETAIANGDIDEYDRILQCSICSEYGYNNLEEMQKAIDNIDNEKASLINYYFLLKAKSDAWFSEKYSSQEELIAAVQNGTVENPPWQSELMYMESFLMNARHLYFEKLVQDSEHQFGLGGQRLDPEFAYRLLISGEKKKYKEYEKEYLDSEEYWQFYGSIDYYFELLLAKRKENLEEAKKIYDYQITYMKEYGYILYTDDFKNNISYGANDTIISSIIPNHSIGSSAINSDNQVVYHPSSDYTKAYLKFNDFSDFSNFVYTVVCDPSILFKFYTDAENGTIGELNFRELQTQIDRMEWMYSDYTRLPKKYDTFLRDLYHYLPCMSTEERSIFIGLMETEGIDKAVEFFNYIRKSLDQKYRVMRQQADTDYVQLLPWIVQWFLGLDTVISSPIEGIRTLVNVIAAKIAGEDIRSYNVYNTSDTYRAAIASQGWLGSVANFIYGVLDAVVLILAFKGLGALGIIGRTASWGAKAASKAIEVSITYLICGTRSFNTKLNECLDLGLDDDTAVALAFAASIVETASEYISVHNLFDLEKKIPNYLAKRIAGSGLNAKSQKLLIKVAVSMCQGVFEMNEEITSGIVVHLMDNLIAKDNSPFILRINALVKDGYSESTALQIAMKEYYDDLMMSALGGFLSGGLLGAFGSSIVIHKWARQGAQIIYNSYKNALKTPGNIVESSLLNMIRRQNYAGVVNSIMNNASSIPEGLSSAYLFMSIIKKNMNAGIIETNNRAFQKAVSVLNSFYDKMVSDAGLRALKGADGTSVYAPASYMGMTGIDEGSANAYRTLDWVCSSITQLQGQDALYLLQYCIDNNSFDCVTRTNNVRSVLSGINKQYIINYINYHRSLGTNVTTTNQTNISTSNTNYENALKQVIQTITNHQKLDAITVLSECLNNNTDTYITRTNGARALFNTIPKSFIRQFLSNYVTNNTNVQSSTNIAVNNVVSNNSAIATVQAMKANPNDPRFNSFDANLIVNYFYELKNSGYNASGIAQEIVNFSDYFKTFWGRRQVIDTLYKYLTNIEFNGNVNKSEQVIQSAIQDLINSRGLTFLETYKGVQIFQISNLKSALQPTNHAFIKSIIDRIPASLLSSIKRIELYDVENPADCYWTSRYDHTGSERFVSAATAGNGVINVWMSNIRFNYIGFLHECGHLVDVNWSYSSSNEYAKAVKLDYKLTGQKAVSNYGLNHSCEDFADSVSYYFTNKLNAFPNRKAYFDSLFASLNKKIGYNGNYNSPINAMPIAENISKFQEHTIENISEIERTILEKASKLENASQLELARLLYYELGKKVDYSETYRWALKCNAALKADIATRIKTFDELASDNSITCVHWAQLYGKLLVDAGFKENQIVVQRLVNSDGKINTASHAVIYVLLDDGSILVADMTAPIPSGKFVDLYNVKMNYDTVGFVTISSEQINQIMEAIKNNNTNKVGIDSIDNTDIVSLAMAIYNCNDSLNLGIFDTNNNRYEGISPENLQVINILGKVLNATDEVSNSVKKKLKKLETKLFDGLNHVNSSLMADIDSKIDGLKNGRTVIIDEVSLLELLSECGKNHNRNLINDLTIDETFLRLDAFKNDNSITIRNYIEDMISKLGLSSGERYVVAQYGKVKIHFSQVKSSIIVPLSIFQGDQLIAVYAVTADAGVISVNRCSELFCQVLSKMEDQGVPLDIRMTLDKITPGLSDTEIKMFLEKYYPNFFD